MDKVLARVWFEKLQIDLINRFEQLESSAPAELYGITNAKFEKTTWHRGDGTEDIGGGVMAVLRGRFFEKAGIHVSTVFGSFSEAFRAQIPGAEQNEGKFWASGISLIAHPRNPHVPAVHLNTRMIITSKNWFGGGADLTPLLDYQRTDAFEDTVLFHSAFQDACKVHSVANYDQFKKNCDEYFYLTHRDEPRGTGGIFFDQLNSGDWEEDFAFTKAVGTTFADVYPEIARRRMNETWTEQEREEQLIRRGRYVEFNLLYDRGTTFGLKTGGNVESILSSMPPLVKWP